MIKQFIKDYEKEYDNLYQAHKRGNCLAGEDEALVYFDNLSKNKKAVGILREFCLTRGDLITSDREAVAFIFTLEKYIEL